MRPTQAIVDLNAIAANVRLLRERLGPVRMMAVVKAQGYGHGSIEVSRTALKYGADALGLATPEEALMLREAGLGAPVLVMGAMDPRLLEDQIRLGIAQTVWEPEAIRAVEMAAARQNRPGRVHLKLDTGMHRLGVSTAAGLAVVLEAFADSPHVVMEGLFSHLADSTRGEDAFVHEQEVRLEAMLSTVRKAGFAPTVHLANSGGVLGFPSTWRDMVRPGLALYGYHPDGIGAPSEGLRPALTWRTRIVHIHRVPSGETIGYGRTRRVEEPLLVATLPVGYADGYSRLLSNAGQVLIRGQRAPIVGRVCMDQCMVDVTGIPEVQTGDEVVLLGEQSGATLWADELALWMGTVSYEVLCAIGIRVPRIYEDG